MNIILYTKKGCPWCVGVLELFAEKHIAYEERSDMEQVAVYLKKNGIA